MATPQPAIVTADPSLAGPFPKLPVTEALLGHVLPKNGKLLDGFVLVSVQHLLETTGSLFEALFSLGLSPDRTFVLGKIYSTCRQVARKLASRGVHVIRSGDPDAYGWYCERMKADVIAMWKAALESIRQDKPRGIIVLDDGGYAVSGTPLQSLGSIPVRGVEQTSSGLWKVDTAAAPPVRVIQVASSAAKVEIEPVLISRAVFKRVRRLDMTPAREYGVIGVGNIGMAVAKGLISRGARVSVFDSDPVNIPRVPGVAQAIDVKGLFRSADVIFGCTGADVLANQPWWTGLEGNKILASCSSHDQEFASPLRAYGARNPMDHPLRDVACPLTSGGELLILRGGFPINFDGTRESVPAADIQMTRGLLLAGVVQAAHSCRRNGGPRLGEQLSARLQKLTVRAWFAAHPERKALYPEELPAHFEDEDWIVRSSRGAPASNVPL